MLSVLAAVALGGIEMCMYVDTTLGGPAEDCSGATNEGQCQQAPDNEFNTCIPAGDGTTNHKITCSGSSIVWAFHNTADCSDDVSKECVFIDPDVLTGSTTNVLISGCSKTYAFDECGEYLSNAEMGMGVHLKFKGSCPASADEPCFSREAEACRILDTSVPPSAAFLACFDEPATTVAERVKMTALTGGDYVLSAGKDQAYEFTRVIVNQHKLNEARPRHPHPPPSPWPSVLYPPHPPHCTRVQKRSSILKIAHDNGEIELTPDHVLLVDGQWAAAHTVKVRVWARLRVTPVAHRVFVLTPFSPPHPHPHPQPHPSLSASPHALPRSARPCRAPRSPPSRTAPPASSTR